MCSTWFNVKNMSKMIQIRNVPDALHRRLKSRAAQSGLSLSDFLLAEIGQVAEQPTMGELLDRLEAQPPFQPSASSAEMIRADRGE